MCFLLLIFLFYKYPSHHLPINKYVDMCFCFLVGLVVWWMEECGGSGRSHQMSSFRAVIHHVTLISPNKKPPCTAHISAAPHSPFRPDDSRTATAATAAATAATAAATTATAAGGPSPPLPLPRPRAPGRPLESPVPRAPPPPRPLWWRLLARP